MAGVARALVLILATCAPAALQAAQQKRQQQLQLEHEASSANPIRKVVTLLQDLQAKVTAEGKKEEELYEKFVCYCKSGGSTLTASIDDANSKIGSLGSSLTAAEQKKAQASAALKDHLGSRDDANGALAKATELREKEGADYGSYAADAKANIAALSKAITAIETGVSGGFLQTGAAGVLRKFAIEKAEMSDTARQGLLAFLAGTRQGYVPQSGEIIGILKELKDEMTKGLAEATSAEDSSIQSHDALVAAKKKEVAALSAQIEEGQMRIGELGVKIAGTTNDLGDTKEELSADSKFLSELGSSCDTKAKEWEEVKKTRAAELQTLAETITHLNDDDSLEVFKKTLPSAASSSFVQLKVNAVAARSRALAAIRAVAQKARTSSTLPARPELDLLALALTGKQTGFDKVISMIDGMVANLKKEQVDDDGKQAYCAKQLDLSDDKKKAQELSISDSDAAIEEMEGAVATLKEEIAALTAGIKKLDKSVAEATAQRKEEHESHTELMASDTSAKELLGWAKNRLNKFYQPKLYKAPPKRELPDAFVQISARTLRAGAAPLPPPETFGPYTKKTEETNGVIAMMDLLIKDLDKEMTESDVSEKEAQREYEAMMASAAEKRAQDSKSITDKTAAKASTEGSLEAEQEKKGTTGKELFATLEYIHGLHGECDWLMQYYEVRKAARASEVDSLGKAKAVLNGADYALLETGSTASAARGFLSSRH